MNSILNFIGLNGGLILAIFTIFLLWNKYTYLITYIIGIIINTCVNKVLKLAIQQPRPNENKSIFNAELASGKKIKFNKYGMPSGHLQDTMFSTIFIFLVFKNIWISLLMLIISLITCYQRIESEEHTILQCIIGGIIGCLLSYYFYTFGKKKIAGLLKYKIDDNGPL